MLLYISQLTIFFNSCDWNKVDNRRYFDYLEVLSDSNNFKYFIDYSNSEDFVYIYCVDSTMTKLIDKTRVMENSIDIVSIDSISDNYISIEIKSLPHDGDSVIIDTLSINNFLNLDEHFFRINNKDVIYKYTLHL